MLFSCFVEVIACPNKRVSQHVFGKKITGCILHRVTSPVNIPHLTLDTELSWNMKQYNFVRRLVYLLSSSSMKK